MKTPQNPRRTLRAQKDGSYVGTGRRKTAVARVRIKPGSGDIKVNGREVDQYFSESEDRVNVTKALEAVGARKQVDVRATAHGGGHCGQSAAILMGMARALSAMNQEWGPKMRESGYLTRDAREVERKKYGRRKARRRFQFSKR